MFVNNKFLTPNIVYEGEVTNDANDPQKCYLVASETSYKERHSNHLRDVRRRRYMKSSVLSKYIWSLKEESITPTIKWRIVRKITARHYLTTMKLL